MSKRILLTHKEWEAVVAAVALYPEHHLDEITDGHHEIIQEARALDRAFTKIRDAMTTPQIRGRL